MLSKPIPDDAFQIDFNFKHSKNLKYQETQLLKLKHFTDKYFKDAKYIDNKEHHAVEVPREKYESWFNAILYKLYRYPAVTHKEIRPDLNVILPTMQKTCARLYVQWIGFFRLIVREFQVELLEKEDVMYILYHGWSKQEQAILNKFYDRCQPEPPTSKKTPKKSKKKKRSVSNIYREMGILWRLTVAVVDKIIDVYYRKFGVSLPRGDLLEMARMTEVEPIWTNGNNNYFKLVGSKAHKPFQNYQEENGCRGTREFGRYEVTWDEKDIDTSTTQPMMEDKPSVSLPLPPSPPPQIQEEVPSMTIYEHRKSNLKKLFNHCFDRVIVDVLSLEKNNDMCEKGCAELLIATEFESYADVIDYLGLSDDNLDTTRSQNFRDVFEANKNEKTFYQLILYMCYQLSHPIQENDDDTQSDVSMTDVPQQRSQDDQQTMVYDSLMGCSSVSANFDTSNVVVDYTNLPLCPSFPNGVDWKMCEPRDNISSYPMMNEPRQPMMYENYEWSMEDHNSWESGSGSTDFESNTFESSVFNQSEQSMENTRWSDDERDFDTYGNCLAGGGLSYGYCGDWTMNAFQRTRYVDPPPRNHHEQDYMEPPYQYYN